MMRNQTVIALACCLCFIVGWFSGHSPVERAAKVNVLFKTVKETVTEVKNDSFIEVIHLLAYHRFQYKGYREIMGTQSTSTVVVPTSISGRQDIGKDALYANERHFIYKNGKKGIVLLVNVSRNKKTTPKIEWQQSYGYDDSYQNAQTGTFHDTYEATLPKIELYTYAFSAPGYNLSVTALAKTRTNDGSAPLIELANFTETLANELRGKGLLQ